MARENLAVDIQAVDLGVGLAYTLVSRKISLLNGPFALECISLRTGAVHERPAFPASPPPEVHGLAIASGYLWVWRTAPERVVSQLDPRDLAIVRSLRLPRDRTTCDLGIAVAGGPGDSAWIGSGQALLRLDTASGIIMARATLPPGAAISDVAVDPARRHLYVSITHVTRAGCVGDGALEYGARTGRRLASATHGLITASLLGAQLTAVPGGVWASFRGGMLGFTIHLRQHDLAMTVPASTRIALRAHNGLFRWAMYGATAYGAGALWVATASGLLACLDPRTGRTRAIERVPLSLETLEPLAADRSSRQLYALGPDGLVQITPPHRCWR